MVLIDGYSKAMSRGFYFDRCIDLDFYNSSGTKIFSLSTPKNGFKPSITVKGTFIQGEYSIASYISIQNLLYSVDVNSVDMILCRMYYSGMTEAYNPVMINGGKMAGMRVAYKVLYADQEKEPPNRAVRFQCVVASQCKEMFDVPIVITGGGDKISVKYKAGKVAVPSEGTGGKKDAKITCTLVSYLKELANARNEYVNSTIKSDELKEYMLIKSIKFPKDKQNMMVVVNKGTASFGEILRNLSTVTNIPDGEPAVKISMSGQSIVITTVPPSNWEDLAEEAGYTTGEQKKEFFDQNYSNDFVTTMVDGGGTQDGASGLGTLKNPVVLSFVKAAYRAEVLIHVDTIFDERIQPGVYCAIKADAIMGKAQAGARLNSRITKLGENMVVFMAVGAIPYEFSTVDGSMMSLTGPVAGG